MLEGPDLAGKTTLAKMIQRRVKDAKIVHRGPPTKTWQEEYLYPLDDMAWRGGMWILDRWHWGEMIYGPLLRGCSLLDDEAVRQVEAKCDQHHVVRVLLLPSRILLEKRWRERGDDLVSLEQLMKVARAYRDLRNVTVDYLSTRGIVDSSEVSRFVAKLFVNEGGSPLGRDAT